MNKHFALLALLSMSCADPEPARDSGATLREMLQLAAEGPADSLRPRLETLARTISDPEIRRKTLDALDSIVVAADLHRKAGVLVKEVAELGGKTTVEPGGLPWMRELAGDPAMAVFERLVMVALSTGTNAHAKDYKLNTRVSDDWTSRLTSFPDLRALN